jgi:hypothetical protein
MKMTLTTSQTTDSIQQITDNRQLIGDNGLYN